MDLSQNLARIKNLVTRVEPIPEFIGAVCPPTFDSTVFMFKDFETVRQINAGEVNAYTYSRGSNPTRDTLNRLLADMENGEAATTVASGTAAIFTTLMSCVRPGAHVVIDRNAYGRPIALLMDEFARFGVTYSLVTAKNTDEVEAALRPETSLIYLESPNSWFFEVQDIRAITRLAKERNIRTAMDNTYSTPVFQNPIDMGVDIVLHSASKYLGGHAASIAGVIVSTREIIEHLTPIECRISASDASRLLLSLRTLPYRMMQHYENAQAVAALLEKHPRVKQVFYPGSPNHPQAALIRQQMCGASGTLSFILDCGVDGSQRFMDALRLIHLGGTWGSYESCIQTTDWLKDFVPNTDHCMYQRHQCRISVGLEDTDSLLSDMQQALEHI